jgi:4-diphosphocytidyl-2-C-methyl-D-erythritol kinase
MQEQFTTIGDTLLVRAPAKINLSLLIAGKREDGFHEIETLMAKVDLYDELLIERGEGDGGRIEFSCTGRYSCPSGSDNIVCQACEMLIDEAGVSEAIKISLTKNIPVGGGLGGGSSDAAAALLGVRRLLGLEISEDRFVDIAGRLGSDVPFFLSGPLALCTGRGEKIKQIAENFPFRAVLILPDVSVSTKRVYENYTHEPTLYHRLSGKINTLLGKKNIDSVVQMCANMLEESCFGLSEELAGLKQSIESAGLGPVCLSGSGSTMFCMLTEDGDSRIEQYQSVVQESLGCDSVVVSNNRW